MFVLTKFEVQFLQRLAAVFSPARCPAMIFEEKYKTIHSKAILVSLELKLNLVDAFASIDGQKQ